MKKARNVVLALLCVLLLIAGSVAGTLAYLQDTKTVTNTFTVGSIAITLDETDVTVYGVAEASAARVEANEYKLIPGHNYTKDPIIHVTADSEACYLFVKVENGIKDIEAATTIHDQMIANDWIQIGESDIYYYKNIVASSNNVQDVPVFDEFTLSGDAVVANYKTAKIIVTAYAVQSDTFNSATDAWNATFGK